MQEAGWRWRSATTTRSWDAACVDAGPEADLAAAVAAAVALDAYQLTARRNIQILGGIGFTWEHDAHLYLRRAATLAELAGPVKAAQDDVYGLTRNGVRRTFAISLPAEAEAYRRDARSFADRYNRASREDRRNLLVDSGYLVAHWPRPWGRAATPVEQLVIEEELAGIEIPSLGVGGWVLLTLTQHASVEQIGRWIDPSLRGQLTWCQLFSEPNAGSDAAAVQTRGTRAGGGWRVTGQKVWTSGAQQCNRGLATIRTGPAVPKHQGITTMVIDLTAPGVQVRPLREITGESLFNEVFLSIASVAGVSGGEPRLAFQYLFARCLSIAGGTSEVGRNVIAERILGLPREPSLT